MHRIVRKLLGQSMRLFAVFSGFRHFEQLLLCHFGVAEFCAFRQYRDPCSFSCHLSSFRGNLSISVVYFVVRFHQVLIMQRIQLAEPVGFFMCFETCCFSLHSSVLVIPQYAQDGQKVSWPI